MTRTYAQIVEEMAEDLARETGADIKTARRGLWELQKLGTGSSCSPEVPEVE